MIKLVSDEVICQAKLPNILWFQPLCYEDFLLFCVSIVIQMFVIIGRHLLGFGEIMMHCFLIVKQSII